MEVDTYPANDPVFCYLHHVHIHCLLLLELLQLDLYLKENIQKVKIIMKQFI